MRFVEVMSDKLGLLLKERRFDCVQEIIPSLLWLLV